MKTPKPRRLNLYRSANGYVYAARSFDDLVRLSADSDAHGGWTRLTRRTEVTVRTVQGGLHVLTADEVRSGAQRGLVYDPESHPTDEDTVRLARHFLTRNIPEAVNAGRAGWGWRLTTGWAPDLLQRFELAEAMLLNFGQVANSLVRVSEELAELKAKAGAAP